MNFLTIALSIISTVAAGASAIWSYSSARTAQRQLDAINRKIGMISDPEKMIEVLPTWYIERMSQDHWCFGILLSSGDILSINSIIGLSDDNAWIEVHLAGVGDGPANVNGKDVLYAPTERKSASVRVDQVQAAFELVTS